jgi:hypothetical protein
MSMRLAVNCPFCKRPMATSAAFAGQMVACPNCRGEFKLNSPGQTPPPSGNRDAFPPSVPASRVEAPVESPAKAAAVAVAAPRDAAWPPVAQLDKVQAPLPILAPPMPAVAAAAPAGPPGTNTARLKTAASAAPTIAPAADGKLPGLLLAEGETSGAGGETGEKSVPLWMACVAVVGSTVLSVFLLLSESPGKKSAASQQAEVRQQIASFYGVDGSTLKPFQVLLREAQQAHSRGDRAMERQKYRQVLALLRSEKRSKYENVTGTPSDDEKLAEWLSILLSNQ